jgi:hypothetical protein
VCEAVVRERASKREKERARERDIQRERELERETYRERERERERERQTDRQTDRQKDTRGSLDQQAILNESNPERLHLSFTSLQPLSPRGCVWVAPRSRGTH